MTRILEVLAPAESWVISFAACSSAFFLRLHPHVRRASAYAADTTRCLLQKDDFLIISLSPCSIKGDRIMSYRQPAIEQADQQDSPFRIHSSTTSFVALTPALDFFSASLMCSKPLPTISGGGRHWIFPASSAGVI
jgi:hypothetical protein